MITIQRVQVRWTALGRGAPEADRRRGLNAPALLPLALPSGDVAIHEVIADESTGYIRQEKTYAGDGPAAGLSLDRRGPALLVSRLPGYASYPRPRGVTRLFTLRPGEVGRYRTNFRWTGCQCDPHWRYEEWHVHVAHGRVDRDRFTSGTTDHEVDHRVHLYGGPSPASAGRRARRGGG